MGTGRSLAVFSHPNHELAVFGLLQRYRPQLFFLTDGGSAKRVAETLAGLETIDLADHAHFLGHREGALYEALLDGDIDFCRALVAELAAAIENAQPESIFCDAVEFYNPVHDLTLPLTLTALARCHRQPAMFELPLIYQRPTPEEAYEIQRLPPSQQAGQIELRMNSAEVAAKLRARDEGYAQLKAQLGRLVDLPVTHISVEVMRPFAGIMSEPGGERLLRYEWRGRLLQTQGRVAQVITYAEHYRRLTAALRSS